MRSSKSVTRFSIPCDLPERTFTQDTRSDSPTYLIFQTPQTKNTEVELERMEEFESSFVHLYSITRKKTKSIIGYAVVVRRGVAQNLGVSLVVRKTRLDKESRGKVDLKLSQDMLKLGDLLRIFKLGDSALYIGAPNDYPPFFY